MRSRLMRITTDPLRNQDTKRRSIARPGLRPADQICGVSDGLREIAIAEPR
jgi:hypothetical protein